MSAVTDVTRIAALADQCVKCGLCLPHCPTYRVGRTEAESPRGRIAFAQALAAGQIAATPSLTLHLDQCLACMSCEPVCPSQVRYGELLMATRSLLHATDTRPRRGRLIGWLLARPRLLRAALRLANLPGARRCLAGIGLHRFAHELPRLPQAASLRSAQCAQQLRGRVGLFLGCVASAVDRDVHAAAQRLLAALGYEVVLPRGQGCCGALALHAGDVVGADKLAAPTRNAFIESGVDTVLVSASGCYGTLRDAFARTPVRVREIHEFVDSETSIAKLKFRPLARRVALHTPCTQRNVARADAAIRRLLSAIPQLDIAALPAQPSCCGAAGDYFLHHPGIADALRTETLEQTRALQPDLLVTSNVGCRIFLDNGLRQLNSNVPVMHPLVLLAGQLEN